MAPSTCRICQEHTLNHVHSFKPIPYGDLYKDNQKAAIDLVPNDLTLVRCKNCGLLQLNEITRLEEQYSEYLYLSSITNKLIPFYQRIAKRLIDFLELGESDHVLDIGSNDGSFLETFFNSTNHLHGVDPSIPACRIANGKRLSISNRFFDSEFCDDFLLLNPKPRLITCNYTIANVPLLGEFFISLRRIMSNETLLNIVTGYHLDQFNIGMFEYINHDHQTYLTLHDFIYLASKHDMKVIYFHRHEHKGGSAEIGLALKESDFVIEDSVSQNLQRETWLDSKSDSLVFSMIRRATDSCRVVNSSIDAFMGDGYKILGIGASISSTSLISEFGLAHKIDTIYDDDVRKQGKFSPGTGISVRSFVEITDVAEKFVLIILSWQHSDRLVERLREIGFTGFLIIPLPFPRITYLSF